METLLSTTHHTSISIYTMEVNGKMGFELSNFELSKVFHEPNPYLTQGIPVQGHHLGGGGRMGNGP